jgi:hypothetical protein
MMFSNTICIYHDKYADGWTVAWAVHVLDRHRTAMEVLDQLHAYDAGMNNGNPKLRIVFDLERRVSSATRSRAPEIASNG